MRLTKLILFCAVLWCDKSASAITTTGVVREACDFTESTRVKRLTSDACQAGKKYRLKYVQRSTQITLQFDRQSIVLQKIPQRYDPSLVGADTVIGFLPESFQHYKKLKILLYISSVRTSGGDGGGQCGSGSEIHLNFLDISSPKPKVKSRILIGSCESSIELFDQDLSSGELGVVSVVNDKLAFKFMNYGDKIGYPTATVSEDFKRLEFK